MVDPDEPCAARQRSTGRHNLCTPHWLPRVSRWGAILVLVVLLTACAPRASSDRHELVVFAAASLTEAFAEIGEAFGAQNDIVVTFNFAGSQTLAGQLASGAPADVFASANDRQMLAAMDAGRIDPSAARTFAANRLVIVTPRENPGAVNVPNDLASPGLRIVFADAAVPVGQYSLQFLAQATADPAYTPAYSPTVLANVVSYEENVRAVLTKVVLGEADAGIVYASDVLGSQRDQVQIIDIPDTTNVVATYPIAPVADSTQSATASAFVDFVLSPRGQSILERYGFQRVEP